MKEEKLEQTPEGMVKYKELHDKYDAVLKNEGTEMDSFTMKVQEYVFDYFNLIIKEYYRSLDIWGQDMDYVNAIKGQYEVIDKQMEEEELSE